MDFNQHRIQLQVAALADAIGASDVSIATAESCTGGMLSSAIVANPQASGALDRAFVVYSIDAKCELLELDRALVEACAGVSEEVARAMAAHALARSRADIAVSITGFAGPREADEEVGLVHLALARRGASGEVRQLAHRHCSFGDIGRDAVNRRAVATALEMLTGAIEMDRANAPPREPRATPAQRPGSGAEVPQ